MASHLYLKIVGLLFILVIVYLLLGGIFHYSRQQSQIQEHEGPSEFRNITDSTKHEELARVYHDYVNKVQVKCEKIVRMGVSDDGGWDVCMDPPYELKKPCLVYSFGIKDEWSFDDAVSKDIGCIVHSFDPSMNISDSLRKPTIHFHDIGLDGMDRQTENNWTMNTLKTIRQRLFHTHSTIDVLKIDIEESEWPSFPDMVRTGSLYKVKQLCFEIHFFTMTDPNPSRYHRGLVIFKDLYNLGYRIFKSHRNPYCQITSKFGPIRYLCHEVYMINVNS